MPEDAVRPLCGRLHATTASSDAHKITRLDQQCERRRQILHGPQWQRGVEHLRSLGPRAVGEFLAELGAEHDIAEPIAAKLTVWRERLTPEMVRAVGGDRWPPRLSLLHGGKK